MAPVKFGDFGKEVSDLLTNDYSFDNKFKLKTKTATGFELTSEGTLKGGNSVAAKFTGAFDVRNGLRVNKLGVGHDGRFFADLGLNDVVKGLSLTTVVEEGGKAPVVGEFGLTYKHPLATGTLKVDGMVGPTLKASLSTIAPFYDKLSLGGEIKYNTGLDSKGAAGAGSKAGGSVDDYTAGLLFKEANLTASLLAKKKLTGLELSVHHLVSPVLELGGQCLWDSKTKSVSLSTGGTYVLDSTTKLQGKFESSGIASLNIHNTLSKNVKMISSVQVDATQLAAATPNAHKFGLQLILSP